MSQSIHPLQLSEQLLYKIKLKEDSSSIIKDLEGLKIRELVTVLNTDVKKLVFWINIYNAYFQILRQIRQVEKSKIYTSREIQIGEEKFSLDEIEHGILRNNRYKYSLGYFSNPFTRSIVKQLKVEKLDYRIHFALNCGAKSCPPIAFYKLDSIQDQLNLATETFLENESIIDDDNKIITTTKLFQWFHNDFGGKKGIVEIFNHHLNQSISGYKIKYSDYSWEEDLNNFIH